MTDERPEDQGEEQISLEEVRRSRRARRSRQRGRDEGGVPPLPRGRFFRQLAFMDIMRIAMFAALLVAIIAVRKPCADSAAHFVGSFEEPADAGPEAVDPLEGYELVPAEELLRRLGDGGTGELGGPDPGP